MAVERMAYLLVCAGNEGIDGVQNMVCVVGTGSVTRQIESVQIPWEMMQCECGLARCSDDLGFVPFINCNTVCLFRLLSHKKSETNGLEWDRSRWLFPARSNSCGGVVTHDCRRILKDPEAFYSLTC